ncbi:Actin-related protein 2/3 complex subunit 2, partial [Penicillium frequentans]
RAARATYPAPPPPGNDDRGLPSSQPAILLTHIISARHAALGLSECFDSIAPHGAVLWVLYPSLPAHPPPGSVVYTPCPPASIDQVASDFDGVTFHVSTPESKTKILLSINVKCFKELVQYGAQEVLEREYGPYIVSPEPGYDFSVQVDLENLPAEQEARDELIMKLALLKRNAMAAPFERAFDEFNKLAEEASRYTSESAPQGMKEGGEVMAIHYREEEAIYIKASFDRVTVIFSTVFREETDRIFGKVFLQEFVDARRRVVTLQNAPQVLFRNDAPLELQGVPGLLTAGEGEISYVTFVLFPRHLTAQRRYDNISHIQTFRDYFHYHIKASKAYIHTRMRKRTADFLQVLNRARPENEERERKTASGRTFRVQS